MPPPRSRSPLVCDPGVLADEPVCAFQRRDATREVGGVAILPWRDAFLRAEAEGFEAGEAPHTSNPAARDRIVLRESTALPDAGFAQCVVHLQKSREGTWDDLAEAWRLLARGGRLLLEGPNELGIVSAVKRLADELQQKPRVVSNRARRRVAAFVRDDGPGPVRPVPRPIFLPTIDGTAHALVTRPGTFSAKQLDAGSELLLEQLPRLVRAASPKAAPKRVLDLACGAGPLGLGALLHWPEATAVLADADYRAVESARDNAMLLELSARCCVHWLDATESLTEGNFDLALLNPPFHSGKQVDLEPARQLFAQLERALAPGGLALVVANVTLPYERDLRAWGEVEAVAHARGYKLLSVTRRSRSASSSRTASPGARSRGSS